MDPERPMKMKTDIGSCVVGQGALKFAGKAPKANGEVLRGTPAHTPPLLRASELWDSTFLSRSPSLSALRHGSRTHCCAPTSCAAVSPGGHNYTRELPRGDGPVP